MESSCVCVSYKSLNAGNNHLTIVCTFLSTETCSFRGSQTHTHERFRRSKWLICIMQLLPFSRACFCVVLAGGMLVLHPATEHCGSAMIEPDKHTSLLRNPCMLILICKHHMRVCILQYTMMKSVLLHWTPSLNDSSKLKGQCTDDKSGCSTS